MTARLSRRAALGAGAALPLAAATAPFATQASAQGSPESLPNTRSFHIGDMKVTTLLDGSMPRDGVQDIFGANVSEEEFTEVSTENFIPADKAQFYFTPTLVDSGNGMVLFDTGLGQGGIQKALTEAGASPEDVDIVVITHMHPDHIGGMTTGDAPTFPNARYVTGQQEYDAWMASGSNRITDLMATKIEPFKDKMTFIGDEDEVVPGITGHAAFGHTPGHMIYRIESAGKPLLLTADMANHYVYPFQNPEWHTSFDSDKEAASATRRKYFDMLATDKIPMIGYHMPFPAAGYVEPRGDGFRFVPVSYQLLG
ncbi:MBL fold metallo-hydrolase [Chachezhania antarctica]|uniref:MBL fold metallo-hydrolase n=1 Tax=Chachezhania antarctica TaxID=2340860 RepID=UPI000EB0FEBF|nr:MBL fold metallo-hydrolase [Chachezhania antarctica]|tara:strand:+ start:2397 stop:3332 length:936 start_codon:yes stop_codon:yes gene_type:complete